MNWAKENFFNFGGPAQTGIKDNRFGQTPIYEKKMLIPNLFLINAQRYSHKSHYSIEREWIILQGVSFKGLPSTPKHDSGTFKA